MKTWVVESLIRAFGFLLILTLTIPGAWAATANTFVLSDEGAGLITKLTDAGYGNLNLYDALQQIVQDTNPSVTGIITPNFFLSLHSCPSNSPIFTTQLENIAAGSSVAISTDCTEQPVNVYGATYYNQAGTSMLKEMKDEFQEIEDQLNPE